MTNYIITFWLAAVTGYWLGGEYQRFIESRVRK